MARSNYLDKTINQNQEKTEICENVTCEYVTLGRSSISKKVMKGEMS